MVEDCVFVWLKKTIKFSILNGIVGFTIWI